MNVLRIANCSGFYGDRLSAAREMVEGGPIDVLTGDYLAELTLLILWKAQQRDPSAGYAVTFLRQMEEVLGACLDRGIKIVSNAGGLNPAGLAQRLRALADRLGLNARIAFIEGDDVLTGLTDILATGERLAHLDTGRPFGEARIRPVAANAYLGGWGIARALELGADIVITPRVTDAALVVGPSAWRFHWKRDDWNRLAGAVAAGHIIECGAQATGGNYAFFQEVPGLSHPGFPIAEMHEDGSFVITKHPGTGGLVSVGTVTAQLLYEIGGPQYLNPDVVARFDSLELSQEGPDRVRGSGIVGEPAPTTAKVCINYLGGYRNSMTFVLTGLDIEEKAQVALAALFHQVGGRDQFENVAVQLIRSDQPEPVSNELASAFLRVTVKDSNPKKVGRAFSNAAVEIALSNYPGLYLTSPPSSEEAYGVYWPTLIPASFIEEQVVAPDGTRIPVEQTAVWMVRDGGYFPGQTAKSHSSESAGAPSGNPLAGWDERETLRQTGGVSTSAEQHPTTPVPLGRVFGARSGDKGGNANVGVWARSDDAFGWLQAYLTVDRFRVLIGEARDLRVDRYEFPKLRALNFVVSGILDEGVASSTRQDAQAKSLGEYLRSKVVDMPAELLSDSATV